MTRPTKSLEWATGVIPAGPVHTLPQAQAGHQPNTQPPPQWMNEWQNAAYQWQQFFDAAYINHWCGDGYDGSVTISSGTTTMTRDMYYNNLTISGTGKLVTNGYRVFVSGTLDLSAAPARAISNSGASAVTSTAGAATSVGTLGIGTAGGNGSLTTGSNGLNTGACANGGQGGTGGVSGYAGGSPGNLGVLAPIGYPNRDNTFVLNGAVSVINGGSGGGGGSGNGAQSGGGGGGGAGVVLVLCAVLNRSGSTATSAIAAIGGLGGPASISAGTGGGGGGGGGYVVLLCNDLSGTAATNILDASGGNGGHDAPGNNDGVGGNSGNILFCRAGYSAVRHGAYGPSGYIGGVAQVTV